MKFVLISDTHATNKTPIARNDDILRTFEQKFLWTLRYAKKHNASILQAGDLFETPRNWHTLYSMIKMLTKVNVPIYTIFGQHDMYMYSNVKKTPTNTSLLSLSGLVHILSNKKPFIIQEEDTPPIYLHGCSWGEEVPKPSKKALINILAIHDRIYEHALFPGHDYISIDYFIKKNPGWKLILIGDIHRHFIFQNNDTLAINTGPMLRKEGTLYNFKHTPCVYLWDSHAEILQKVKIPHVPANEVLSRKHLITRPKDVKSLTSFKQIIQKKQRPMTLNYRLKKAIKKFKANNKVKKILSQLVQGD